jgi:DNA-binding transcriptional ArsR family regulator
MSNYDIVFTSGKTEEPVKIETLNLKKAAIILRAVNHKLRQQILKFIDEKGKVIVSEIFLSLHLEQSVASQHLAVLRKAGFVNADRDGKFIHYSVNTDRIKDVTRFVENLLK